MDQLPNPPTPAQQILRELRETLIVRMLVAIPIACLVTNALAWLIHGVDVPFWDDWRPLLQGEAGDLSIATLFRPANDTLYPVGLLLDSLAQRYFLGNSVVYQFVSLTLVLGGLLLLQWRLLGLVFSDARVRACLFATTLFMLQPDSYWGLQNMAYHQALPLLGLFFILDVIYRQEWRPLLSPVLVAIVGGLSGLTYISGAFAMLVGGVALLTAAWISGDRTRSTRVGAATMTVVGVATSIPQGWVIAFLQHGVHTKAPMALPYEPEFWMFLLGKVARALMLPARFQGLSLAITLIIVATLVACTAILISKAWHQRNVSSGGNEDRFPQLIGICACVFGVVAMYLAMVAAGRTNLRDPSAAGMLQVFGAGFPRFHFFWATAAWPWLGACLLILTRPHVDQRRVALIGACGAVLYTMLAGVFHHGAWYASATEQRVRGIECLIQSLEERTALKCETLYPDTDLRNAVRNAGKMGASFSRTLELTQTYDLPLITGPNQGPIVLGGGRTVRQSLSDPPRISAATHAAVFLGTYGGSSDGTLVMKVCQEDRCTEGKGDLRLARDNQFFQVELSEPVEVSDSAPVAISLATEGATHPVAVWGFAAPSTNVSLQSIDAAGQVRALPDTALRARLTEEL